MTLRFLPLHANDNRQSVLQGRAFMADVLQRTAERHGVAVSDLLGPSRLPALCRARWEAWEAIYRTGRFSLTQIGKFFGRDHTSIRHGIRRCRELISEAAA